MWLVIEKWILNDKVMKWHWLYKLSYVIINYTIYFDYVFVYLYFFKKCDNSLPVCYLCVDPVMISIFVFVGADD